MQIRRATLPALLIALALGLAAGLPLLAEEAPDSETCLMCHGPFDKLVEATAGYTWPGGEVVSPHQYVPHDSKTVADCSLCHKAHPLPPTAEDIKAMAAPDPSYCFECHHTKKLSCGTCHPVPAE